MLTNQLSLFSIVDTPLDQNIIYSPVADEKDLRDFISLWKAARYFGLDIETYGKGDRDGLRPWIGRIRLIQIALPNGTTGVFDLGGWKDYDECRQKLKDVGFFDALKELCENPNILKIGHNLKFDIRWIEEHLGIKTRGIRCTQMLSQLYWAGLKSYKHNLKYLAKRVLDKDIDKTEQISDWGWELSNRQINYAALDARLPIDIFLKLGKMLKDENLDTQAIIECDAVPVFSEMEIRGLPVDWELLQDAIGKYKDAQLRVSEPFCQTFPNIELTASNDTLLPLFKEKLGIELTSSGDEVLQGHRHIPEINGLILFRTLKKNLDYLLGMQINYRDGYCRGSYRQQAPKGFGRSTCGSEKESEIVNTVKAIDGINLQNIPKHPVDQDIIDLGLPPVRSIFRPAKGRSLFVADLSQAHARFAVEASRCKSGLAVYNNGKDMHCITAEKLAKNKGLNWTSDEIKVKYKSPKDPDNKVATELRNISKNVYYGSLNRQGKNALLKSAAKGGVPMSERDAEDGLKAWKEAYNGIFKFQLAIVKDANFYNHKFNGINEVFGEVRGLSGRRIFMPKMPDFNGNPSVYAPDAAAFFWTGTEADVIKYAGSIMYLEFCLHPEWEAFICNCAHDELDIEGNTEYKDEIAQAIDKAIKTAMGRWVKSIPVDDGASPNKLIVNHYGEK